MPPHRSCLAHARQPGATLIEQILVVAVAAILAGLALPAFRRLLSSNEVRITQADLISGLNHARALAVQTGRTALICPSRDAMQCSDEPTWTQNWLVGFRGERQGQLEGLPSHQRENRHAGLTILSTQGRRSVQFQPDGSAGGSNITLLICRHGDSGQVLSVKVSNAGRVRGDKATAEEAQRCAGG